MEALFAWVKNIVSFLLILTLVFELLPTKDYGKYVRVSAGMLLLMVIISPLANAMGLSENLDFYLSWENLKSRMDVELLDNETLEAQRLENIIGEYKKNLEEQIRRILKSKGYAAGAILLEVDLKQSEDTFGQIISMKIYDLKEEKESVPGTVDKIEIQSVNIGERKDAQNHVDSNVIIGLKRELSTNFCMDINQILIDGG